MFAISDLVHHLITGLPHKFATGPIIPISILLNTLKTTPSLVHIMVYCLFSTKPLYKSMMAYSYLNRNTLQLTFHQNPNIFMEEKCLKMLTAKWHPFHSSLNMLIR